MISTVLTVGLRVALFTVHVDCVVVVVVAAPRLAGPLITMRASAECVVEPTKGEVPFCVQVADTSIRSTPGTIVDASQFFVELGG